MVILLSIVIFIGDVCFLSFVGILSAIINRLSNGFAILSPSI